MARCDRAIGKLGALRARLLGRAGVRALVAEPDAAARLALLRGAGALDAAPDRDADPELALDRRLRRDAVLLLAQLESRRARELFRAFLLVDEARGLAAVLRRAGRWSPPEEAVALLEPSAWFPPALARALAAAASPAAAAAVLRADGSPLAAPLEEALAARSKPFGALRVDAALRRAAFAHARAVAAGRGEDAAVTRHALGLRADVANAVTALALGASLDPELLVAAGTLAHADLARAAAARPGERPRAIAAAVAAGWGARVDPAALAAPLAAEAHLERIVARAFGREARRRPLSLAVPIAWVLGRRAEIHDAALALRASAGALPPADLAALLEA
jgi:V/A-type H+-transporting ATPase subunit C